MSLMWMAQMAVLMSTAICAICANVAKPLHVSDVDGTDGSAHDKGATLIQIGQSLNTHPRRASAMTLRIRQHLEADDPDELRSTSKMAQAWLSKELDTEKEKAKMAQAMTELGIDYNDTSVHDETHHVSQKTWNAAFGLLKKRAQNLRSTRIMALAAQASKSPFDKIGKLIQELIERLLQEAADDANHQGWCNKQVGIAKETRDGRASEVAHYNIELASSEETRDGLEAEIQTLSDEISELEDAFEKVEKERKEESAENSLTVKEAEEGAEAVGQALDIIDKFYKTAAKAGGPALVQVSGPSDDMPDAGFEGAYTGGQEESKGILGMLEVIESDFQRTIKTTEEAELKARNNFREFGTETKSSLAMKSTTKSAKTTMLTETKSSLAVKTTTKNAKTT